MKSFDLTFNGAVLPEYDPEQVKRDFALLFRIEDAALMEEIFSGETLVLRYNLDRKSAADYFRKITQLGGQATLVASNTRNTNPNNNAGKLDGVTNSPTHFIRDPAPENDIDGDSPFQQSGEIDQTWPISNARMHRQQEGKVEEGKTKHSTRTDNPRRNLEPRAISVTDDDIQIPLTRLRTVAARTKNKLQERSSELERQSERINHLASEKLAKIDQLSQATLERGKHALAELRQLEDKETHAANVLANKIQQQETLTRERSEQEIARVEALEKRTSQEEVAALNQLQQTLKKTRQSMANELKRIRSLLQETRRQAEIDIDVLEQKISARKTKTRKEITNLDQCKVDTLQQLERELHEQQQQFLSAKQEIEKNTAELKQRQQDTQRHEKEELNRLRALQCDITQQRDQEIMEVEQANTLLRRRTQKALKHVHALELEVKRRQHDTVLCNTDQEANSSQPTGRG